MKLAGPKEFTCLFEGNQGWAVIAELAAQGSLLTHQDLSLRDAKILDSYCQIAMEDIRREARATVFINTAVESVAAVLSNEDLLPSLEVEGKDDVTRSLIAIPEGDELLVRLLAISIQKWENI
jgi:hypothetical protein